MASRCPSGGIQSTACVLLALGSASSSQRLAWMMVQWTMLIQRKLCPPISPTMMCLKSWPLHWAGL
eukprot:10239605-Karenia_brevis.AAC.1